MISTVFICWHFIFVCRFSDTPNDENKVPSVFFMKGILIYTNYCDLSFDYFRKLVVLRFGKYSNKIYFIVCKYSKQIISILKICGKNTQMSQVCEKFKTNTSDPWNPWRDTLIYHSVQFFHFNISHKHWWYLSNWNWLQRSKSRLPVNSKCLYIQSGAAFAVVSWVQSMHSIYRSCSF